MGSAPPVTASAPVAGPERGRDTDDKITRTRLPNLLTGRAPTRTTTATQSALSTERVFPEIRDRSSDAAPKRRYPPTMDSRLGCSECLSSRYRTHFRTIAGMVAVAAAQHCLKFLPPLSVCELTTSSDFRSNERQEKLRPV